MAGAAPPGYYYANVSGSSSGSGRKLQKIPGYQKPTAAAAAPAAAAPAAAAPVAGGNVPTSIFSDQDILRNAGRFRASADANANAQIANTSARLGGDTASPLFNFLSSNIRGGAAADYGTQLLKARMEAQTANAGQANEAESLRLQGAGLGETIRSNRAGERNASSSLIENSRQFNVSSSQQQQQLEQTGAQNDWQSKIARVQAADKINSSDPFGSQLGELLGFKPNTGGADQGVAWNYALNTRTPLGMRTYEK